VLVTGKFQGDTAKFRHALADRAGEFEKIADMPAPRARSIAVSGWATASS